MAKEFYYWPLDDEELDIPLPKGWMFAHRYEGENTKFRPQEKFPGGGVLSLKRGSSYTVITMTFV